MRTQRHEHGFSLLEVIIVLAIMGGALVMYTNHVRKESLRTAQQNVANALVLEMKGVINFLHDNPLPLRATNGTGDDEIDNPLYGDVSGINDISLKKYHNRLTNSINDIDTGATSDYLLWGESNISANQQRYLFISSRCNTILKSELDLSKEYLPCLLNSSAKNSSATINRIGFAGENLKSSDSSIARMDVIVSFTTGSTNERFQFADYATPFTRALNNAGLIASHMMVVHRAPTSSNWQLLTQSDGKTPIDIKNLATNISVLSKYPASEYFGVRFTFDMNDNSNGSGGNGGNAKVCWDSEKSTVVHCFEQYAGEDDHGEDYVLALTTKPSKDEKDPTKIKPGTLNANLIMENTSRRVYIFKRQSGGNIQRGSDGQPELYEWMGSDNTSFVGEYYQDDNRQADPQNTQDAQYNTSRSYYVPNTYDAFELVTPAVVDYIANRTDNSYRDSPDYVKYNDANNEPKVSGALRYPIQVCPKIKQKIFLRDYKGDFINNNEYVEVERRLFPRLSVSISSLSAFPGGNTYNGGSSSGVTLSQLDRNRADIDESVPVGKLGGITTQVDIAEQDKVQTDGTAGINRGGHYIYENPKYIWAISNTLGIYDGKTGQGMNVVNSADVSYTVTRWCSTIPQTGTPSDLIESYVYE